MPQRGQGRPAWRYTARGRASNPSRAELRHALAGERDDRKRLTVGDCARLAPGVQGGRKAALGLPQVADAGQRPLVQQGIADRAGGVVFAQPAQEPLLVEGVTDDVLAESRQPRIGRARSALNSSSTGPSNWTTSCSAARSTSQARRGARRQRSPRGLTPQAPVIRRWEWTTRPPSKRRNRCLPWASTDSTARPARRSGQRSERWRGCGVRISCGT